MRVLGVDPGLRRTGYAIIETKRNDSGSNFFVKGTGAHCSLLEAGIINTCVKEKFVKRLDKIYCGLKQIMEEYRPDILVLEELYSHYKNPRTAILMAHARGVICLAAAQMRMEVVGYSAKKIKKSITGSGNAKKFQIQRSVKEILGLKTVPSPDDAADALALAIAYLQMAGLKQIDDIAGLFKRKRQAFAYKKFFLRRPDSTSGVRSSDL